jgi:hypothetical protein
MTSEFEYPQFFFFLLGSLMINRIPTEHVFEKYYSFNTAYIFVCYLDQICIKFKLI